MTGLVGSIAEEAVSAGRRYRAYLYARVSVDRGRVHKGRSSKAQLRDLHADADRRTWDVVGEWVDDDRSASRYATREREQYEHMVAGVKAGLADVIGVWEPARLSRSLDEWVPLRGLLRDLGVMVWVSVHQRMYDMRVLRDEQDLTRYIHEAEVEAAATHLRTSRTARQVASDGGIYGKIPYGYRREYSPDTGELLRQVPDEGDGGPDAPANVVREIIRRVAAQEPLKQICRDLDERKVPTPTGGSRWHHQSVRRIAGNPVYAGFAVMHGGRVPAVWEGLVDEADHLAAAAVLNQRAAAYAGPKPGPANAVHLLSGLAKCGRPECGAPLERLCGTSPPQPRYSCGGCTRVSITQGLLEDIVEAYLLAWLEKPGRAEQILEASGQEKAAESMTELRRLEAQLEEQYQLATAGELSGRGLAVMERRLLPLIEQARARVEVVRVAPEVLRAAAGERTRAVWQEMTITERRAVVRVVVSVRVSPLGARMGGKAALKRAVDRVSITPLLGR